MSSGNDVYDFEIIHPADRAQLVARGLLIENGSEDIKISGSALYSEDYSVSAEDSTFISIPASLRGSEVLQFCGYENGVADDICKSWRKVEEDFGVDFAEEFIDFALGRLEYPRVDAFDDSDDWHECARFHRIKSDVVVDIMDKAFSDIRLTESAVFWFRDVVKRRYEALEAMFWASRRRQGLDWLSQPLSQQPPTPHSPPSVSTFAQLKSVASSAGRLCLWSTWDLNKQRIQVTERCFNLRNLQTGKNFLYGTGLDLPIPNDFSSSAIPQVWTCSSPEAAERYSAFTKRRVALSRPVVLKLSIPAQLMGGLVTFPRDFGVWKEMVWRNHNGTTRDDTKRQREQRLATQLYIGPAFKRNMKRVRRWQDLKEEDVLCLSGENGQMLPVEQYCFHGFETVEMLEERAFIELGSL